MPGTNLQQAIQRRTDELNGRQLELQAQLTIIANQLAALQQIAALARTIPDLQTIIDILNISF